MTDLTVIPPSLNRAQLQNLVTENVERMEDDRGLDSWLPNVVSDVSKVTVGIWACPSGECDCCTNDKLWESPVLPSDEWAPECLYCERKALLVEVVGVIDYSELPAA
jgi:hypothetical protein